VLLAICTSNRTASRPNIVDHVTYTCARKHFVEWSSYRRSSVIVRDAASICVWPELETYAGPSCCPNSGRVGRVRMLQYGDNLRPLRISNKAVSALPSRTFWVASRHTSC